MSEQIEPGQTWVNRRTGTTVTVVSIDARWDDVKVRRASGRLGQIFASNLRGMYDLAAPPAAPAPARTTERD